MKPKSTQPTLAASRRPPAVPKNKGRISMFVNPRYVLIASSTKEGYVELCRRVTRCEENGEDMQEESLLTNPPKTSIYGESEDMQEESLLTSPLKTSIYGESEDMQEESLLTSPPKTSICEDVQEESLIRSPRKHKCELSLGHLLGTVRFQTLTGQACWVTHPLTGMWSSHLSPPPGCRKIHIEEPNAKIRTHNAPNTNHVIIAAK